MKLLSIAQPISFQSVTLIKAVFHILFINEKSFILPWPYKAVTCPIFSLCFTNIHNHVKRDE